jgi:ABC-type enterochelin transport system permease subunit
MILYKNEMILSKNESRAFWIAAFVAILSASISAGFSVANVATQGMGDISALYGVSRSLAILLVALVAAVRRSKLGVATVSLIMTLVQLGDTIVGVLAGDTLKTIGPLILALGTAITLVLLLGKYNESSTDVPYSPEGS